MKIFKAELIQLIVSNGTGQLRFYFPDNSVLRNTPTQVVKTKGIEFYPSEAVPLAPDGNTVMSSADLREGFLVLYISEGEYLKVPISKFVSLHNNSVSTDTNYPYVTNLAELADLMVNYPKSYVMFPAAITTDRTILCNVYYDFFVK